MKIPIIFEDNYLLVIDKPAGLVVNKAESVKEETLQEWAEKKFKVQSSEFKVDKNGDFYKRAGIVHRLDKETSGLLIIAKTPGSFEFLQAQFKDRTVAKKYITLAHGKLPREGEINATVGRLPWNRERFGVLLGGREAVTFFRLLKLYKSQGDEYFSLLEVTPQTGRTHQIRIHLKYIGHPVVSDAFYGGRKVYRRDKQFCPRLFLHATYLKIRHPKSNEWLEFRDHLPKDLEEVLLKLHNV